MSDDMVLTYVKRRLQELGFCRVKNNHYVKELAESIAKIELHNNSFNKQKHYIGVTIVFKENIRLLHGMTDGFGIWLRIGGLDPKTFEANFDALDAGTDIAPEERISLIDRVLDVELCDFLNKWSTFESARIQYQTGCLETQGVSYELKELWGGQLGD